MSGKKKKKIKYGIYCVEKAPTTDHLHMHLFVNFFKQVYGSRLKRLLPEAHLEQCKGSDLQNINYIKKGGCFWQVGDAPSAVLKKQEKAQYYIDLINDCKNLDDEELLRKYPDVYFNNYQKILDIRTRENQGKKVWQGNLKEKNFWIWGAPGTGKTSLIHTTFVPEHIYEKNCNKWWNGLDVSCHKCILLDDFPGDAKYLAQFIKIWGDRYPFNGELKGGHVWINPGEYFLVITSNYCIDDIFDPTDAEAIKRRFHSVCFDNIIERGIEFDRDVLMKKKKELEHKEAHDYATSGEIGTNEEEQRAIEEDHRSWFSRTTTDEDDSILSSPKSSQE